MKRFRETRKSPRNTGPGFTGKKILRTSNMAFRIRVNAVCFVSLNMNFLRLIKIRNLFAVESERIIQDDIKRYSSVNR